MTKDQKNIKIKFDKYNKLEVNADRLRVGQIVINLITNAIKYGRDDGHIWINAKKEGDNVIIEIRDDGLGIGAKNVPKLFDKMFQVSQGSQRSASGAGFGLYLSKRIV